MKKNSIQLLLLLFLTCPLFSQVQIGDGTDTDQKLPFDPYYGYSYGQSIYLASEINASGSITSIKWYYSGSSAIPNSQTLKVYLGHTTKSSFTDESDFIPLASLTQVYAGGITTNATPGWKTITLTTPFAYNGSSNLVVAVDENMANYDDDTDAFYNTAVTSTRSIAAYSDTVNPNPSAPDGDPDLNYATADFIPNIIFGGITQSCPAPTNLSSTTITTTTATITWQLVTTPSGGTQYYRSTSNTPPTATTTPTGSVASGTSVTLTGLSSGTTYYVWVRNNCGGGDLSTWSSAHSFTTVCTATTAPYVQDFESATAPNLPNCTSVINAGSGNNWETDDNSFDSDYGFGTKKLKYGTPYDGNPANSWFFTQGISLIAGTSYSVSYKYGNNDNTSVERLRLRCGTSATVAGMTITLATHSNINTASAQNGSVVFTPTTTGVYYFGFNVYSAADQGSLFLDDIAIQSCATPTNLSSTAITTNAATITWQSSTTPSGGTQYYRSTSSTPPTSTTTPTGSVASGTSVNLTGLNSGTTYYVWVRNNCGAGDLSTWSSLYSFTTVCTAASAPYVQDFELATAPNLPNCTSVINAGTGNNWEVNEDDDSFYGFSSKKLKYTTDFFGSNPANSWFFTQGITLTVGTSYAISYRYGNDFTFSSEKLKVKCGTSATVAGMTIALADHPNINTASAQNNTIIFTPTTTGVYYFGFNVYSDADQGSLFLDDIAVQGSATCTWSGSWSPQVPTSTDAAIINTPYNAGSFSCLSLVLNADVTLSDGQYLDVTNGVTGTGKIIISSEASLVQHNSTAPAPIIELTKKTRTGMHRYDYIYWGTPISGNFFSQLAAAKASTATLAGAFDLMYQYNSGTGGGWQALTATQTGKGFITRIKEQAPFTNATNTDYINLKFTGTANNGDITVPVTNDDTNFDGGTSHVLLANPYPSAIDADLFLQQNFSIDGAVYIWTSAILNDGITAYNQADYIAYTRAGAVVPAPILTTFSGKIASGQGFKVKAFGADTVTFTNSMRLTANNDQFYKQNSTTENPKNRFKLNMTGNNGTTRVFSQVLIAYLPEATYGYDRMYDAGRNSVSTAQLYSIFDNGRKLAINARPDFVQSDIVPLGISKNNTETETFSIAIDQKEGLFAQNDINVLLHDKELEVYHNFNNGEYTFTTNSNTVNNRFEIVYNTTLDTNSFDNEVSIWATIKDHKLTVSATNSIQSVSIYDLTGRLVQTYTVEGKTMNQPFYQAAGIYIAQFKMSNGATYSKKLTNQE